MNSFPPSTRIPHPIQTQSTGSLTTNTSINDARNSPLSASTTTTSGPNSAGNNGNSQIPPLPAISSQAPQFGSNANDNNNNNNSGFHPFPDSPTATNSFPPPPTNTSFSANTQNTNDMSVGTNSNNGNKDQFGNPINNMNNMNGMNFNNNNFGNNGMITGTVTSVDNNMNGMNNMNNMGFNNNMQMVTTNAPTYVNTSYNPQQMNMPQTTTYNIVPVNNMNNGMGMNNMNGMSMNGMNNFNNMNMMNNGMNNMNGMNMNNNMNPTQIMDDAATQQMNGTVITNVNNMGNNNNMNYSVNNDPFNQMNQNGIDNGDKSKYIDDDLENGRKNYLDILRNVNFRDENYQTCASKWIRTCIEKYQQNEDIYHTYLLNLIQSLINSIGDDKTVRGLKRTWMSYNNIENEWSFLHMICSKNLLYLFQSILGLLQTYKHELLIAMTTINKDSKLRISPLYCCIINGNHQFTKFLFEYYLANLQSNDMAHILNNGAQPNDTNNSLITQLINHHHNETLQQIININAARSPSFLTMQQCQMIITKLNPQQNQHQNQPNHAGSDVYSVNAFSK